jgi:glycosyltransferase involved in cell wall biosynthesis
LKPRLILATDSHEPSGVGENMVTLGAALVEDYDVILAAPHHAAGLSLLHRGAVLGLGVKALDLGQPRQVRSWLEGFEDALLHVHAGIGWEGHDLVRLGKAAGLTVLRTEHLPYLLTDPVQQAAYRAMLLSVDGRIAVSQTVHDTFKDHGGSRIGIVRNGIAPQPATVPREETRHALGLSESSKLLLTVARLSPQKGHSVLIAAAPAVLKRFPDSQFVLVGAGPEEERLARLIDLSGLRKHFIFVGRRDDVPDLLEAADLFVLPSLFEGLPLALLEAVAAKLPAVATTAGGSVEVLGSDHPFLATTGSVASLAEAIARALGDPHSAEAAAQASYQRFTDRFSAARMAAETAAFYQSILQSRGARGSHS